MTWNGTNWGGVIDSVAGNPEGVLYGYSLATDPVNTDVANQVGPNGLPDKAYNFIEPTGISGVNTNNMTAIPATGDFTILVQMKTTNPHTSQGHLFSNNNAQVGRGNLGINAGALFWFLNGTVNLNLSEDSTPAVDGKWHEVGVSRQGDKFYLLRDGFAVASGTSTNAVSQTQQWCIGRQRSYAGDFDGQIGDVKIYNQVYTEVIQTRAFAPTPADGALGVSVSTTLKWNTALDPTNQSQYNPAVTKHYLYINTEPNFLNTTPIMIAASGPIGSHSVTLETDKIYYWRVDEGLNNAPPSDPNTVKGFIWSFETMKSMPVITQQPASLVVVALNGTAEFTVDVATISPLNYQWYKSTDNSNNTPGDDTTVGPNSNTLVISNAQVADEGYYYCKATNLGGMAISDVGKLKIKKLLGHWKLDGNASDSSGNGNHGTLFGASGTDPNWVTGIDGLALNAYGTNYIEIPNESFFDHYDTMTVSAWVKGTAFGAWEGFVSKHSYITGWELNKHGNPNVAGFIVRRGTDYLRYDSLGGTKNIEDDNWHLLTAVLNGLTGQRQLYVDGLLEISAAYDYTQMQNGGDAPVRIAVTQFNDVLDSPVTGMIDDVKIYNYPLAPLEIATEYATISGTPVCLTKPALDYNGNCKVDMYDFAEFAAHWLDCGIVPDCLP